jgi:hypothetical protein
VQNLLLAEDQEASPVALDSASPLKLPLAFAKLFLMVLLPFLPCGTVHCQEVYSDQRPRLVLGTEVGSEIALGYEFPSVTLDATSEIPIGNRFEAQLGTTYSPAKKAITDDGQRLGFSGSAIAFANQRIGFIATVEHKWLWTSEFDKEVLYPSAGVVLRNGYFGTGRLYLTYTFPTGCVSATPGNPCKIQSNRLQGVSLRQEARSYANTRWGFEAGLYHFCAQANPNDPQAGRDCHLAPTALVTFDFEFHCGHKARIVSADAVNSDNY